MRGKQDAGWFVEELARLQFPNVFNPYRDLCPISDRADAVEIRRRNLALAIHAALSVGVESLWVARDLGYRGGRRTGLAMTDDLHVEAHGRLLRTSALVRATKGPAVAERTATVIWQTIREIDRPVFLWNVFPLHPHEPGDPMSNRQHTKAEREAAAPFLAWLIETFRPHSVIAIGNDAHKALAAIGIERGVVQVRHPSYGGQREFVSSTRDHYGIAAPPQADLFH